MQFLSKQISPRHRHSEKGMTLIETIVALGLLTTGIIGGLALAIYSLGSSEDVLNQITATNLAREGIEVIRGMRDTNWLNDSLGDCSSKMGTGQQCYNNWENSVYHIMGNPPGKAYQIVFDPLTSSWSIVSQNSTDPVWKLYAGQYGTYVTSGSVATAFSRQIVMQDDRTSGFSANNPRKYISSIVWWTDRGCPASATVPTASKCKVEIQEYLTNWKNF